MAEGRNFSIEQMKQRMEMAKMVRKELRRTARHLEKTGLTRSAALVLAGEMVCEMRISEGDVSNVVSLERRRNKKKA